jgi:hypothetical protein
VKISIKMVQKLQVFVNRCLWNILGIWWPEIITNEELWKRTGQSDINVDSTEIEKKIASALCNGTWNPHCFSGS